MQKLKNFTIMLGVMLICLTSSLMFVGCKNDDNSIRLNEVTHSIFYAPLYLAKNLGFFEDEGLKVTIESATGSDASMTALISGSADMILCGPEQVVYADGKKNQPIVFGQLTHTDGSFFVSKTDMTGFNLDSLKGKTIIGGREGGMPAMTLEYIIRKHGLTIGTNVANDEVNLRTNVAFPMIASEFQTTSAEFCTLFEPTATNLEKENKGYVLNPVGEFAGEIPYTCFATTQNYLTKHSDKAEKFLRAVKRAYTYLLDDYTKNSNYTSSANALVPSFTGMSVTELEVALRQYVAIGAWTNDFTLSEQSYNKLLDILNFTQGAKLGTTYDALYSKVVNNDIAKKLNVA